MSHLPRAELEAGVCRGQPYCLRVDGVLLELGSQEQGCSGQVVHKSWPASRVGRDGLLSLLREDICGRAGEFELVADVAEDLFLVHGLHLVVDDDPLGERLGLVKTQPGDKKGQARDDEHEGVLGVHGEVEDHRQVQEEVGSSQVHLVQDEDGVTLFSL